MKINILPILFISLCLGFATAKYSNIELVKDLAIGSFRVVSGLIEDLYYKTPELTDDAYKSPAEFYQSYGYRFEQHKIVTEDGYILSAWRIPGKLTESFKDISGKPAVMLQHGLLDNSGTFTVGFSNQSLPILLCNEGYDVWITNTRGNFNSFEHTNPKEYSVFDIHSKYWNFTFDSMGYYDLPSNIDYILDYTDNKKLTYIGHSQGTIQFFAGNSIKNIASKVDSFVGLGPVMYVENQRSPIITLLKVSGVSTLLKWLDFNNLLIWPTIVNVSLKSIVRPLRKTVFRFIQMIVGLKKEVSVDLSRMPVMGRHEPGGTNLQNMMHWLQMVVTGNFARYNYGKEENLRVYGQEDAPFYDLEVLKENIKDLDMFLIRGSIDVFVAQEDFDKLLDVLAFKLGTTLNYKVVKDYDHLDYIWADSSYEEVALPVLEFLRNKRANQ
ncbi:unnamed protein product [Moneuplotes crassus]|uniref:Lipase n=1 Tax=Euplotes crassus TaxID=5936 RepID=A0AAD1XBR6_EUPCR|nr:unnamed protein product [Moneuplotes crassus]